jgi:transposase-like protein
MSCGICTNKVASRGLLKCPSCAYDQCHACLKQYFSGIAEPKCANCNVVFTREFLSTTWKSFAKEYEVMRGKALVSFISILLP